MNVLVLRLAILRLFLQTSHEIRTVLVDELIDNATDPILRLRRFRMLANLAAFESMAIEKIGNFDGDVDDWEKSTRQILSALNDVVHRSS